MKNFTRAVCYRAVLYIASASFSYLVLHLSEVANNKVENVAKIADSEHEAIAEKYVHVAVRFYH